MDDVKRYGLEYSPEAEGDYMAENPNGVWVRYCDYTALRARLEAVEKERDEAKESARWAYIDGCLDGDDDAVLARAERAEAALATARRDAELLNRIVLPMVEQRSREQGDAWDQAAAAIRALANEAKT